LVWVGRVEEKKLHVIFLKSKSFKRVLGKHVAMAVTALSCTA
jgi:hypothetical protein